MIVLTGYFEEYEKYSLIKNAKALLLISKEEGFGFPVLEAQSVGVPVITSNRSSLKEISQDSAILIEPDSIDSILSAMHQVISKEFELDKLLQKGN
ncbi:MAG: glycosyltransferase [Ignavibacteriales bacterium]|nr:glycosyltransferase [Ignavibacteriales bacterium]